MSAVQHVRKRGADAQFITQSLKTRNRSRLGSAKLLPKPNKKALKAVGKVKDTSMSLLQTPPQSAMKPSYILLASFLGKKSANKEDISFQVENFTKYFSKEEREFLRASFSLENKIHDFLRKNYLLLLSNLRIGILQE